VQLAHVKLCGINQARLHLGVRQPREQEDLILGKAEQPDITGLLLPATGDATDGQTVVVATRKFRFFLNFLQHRGLHHVRDILLHVGVLFGFGFYHKRLHFNVDLLLLQVKALVVRLRLIFNLNFFHFMI